MDVYALAMNAKLEAMRLCNAANVAGVSNALKWDLGVVENSANYIRQLTASMRAADQAQQQMQQEQAKKAEEEKKAEEPFEDK